REGSTSGEIPQFNQVLDECVERVKGHHVGPIARCMIWIGVRFHEEAVGAGPNGRAGEWRNELARTATRAPGSPPRLLHAVSSVEDDRSIACGPHARKAAHVNDEITVAEEGTALGDGDLGGLSFTS